MVQIDGVKKNGPGENETLARKYGDEMTRFAILFFVFTGLTAIGLVVLSNWQIPAPTVAVNKVIANETLPK